MNHPETSVIIRTFNEEKFLPDLLAAIERQAYRDHETIVVDSGSMDRTREIAAQKADKLLAIESRDFTFGHSLNAGIQQASGKYIVIASAHTLPFNECWLGNLIKPLYDDTTAMVYGRQLGARSSNFSEAQDMRRTFGLQRRVLRPPRFFANNANSAICKDLWRQHPFDEGLLGLEDVEWAKYWMERGYQVVYEPQAALYHIHAENWRQIRRRYYREAVAARWIGIQTTRHAVVSSFLETARLILDWGHFLYPGEDRRTFPLRFSNMVRETIRFRANKSIGTVKGLLDGRVMENPNLKKKMLFDRTCKAVVIHGARQAAIEEIEIPEVKPGDTLIRVAYEAVCATDIEIYEGTLGYYQNGIAKYPIVPGHEFSGRVVSVGSNVNHLEVGDLVVVECIQSCGNCEMCRRENAIACRQRTELGVMGRNGGYAEYVVVPGRYAHRLPPDFELIKACLCEPLAVALKGLKRLRRTWRDRKMQRQVAVVGAGSLGHLCARVLEHWGHRVTVFDQNRDRLKYFSGSDISVSNNLSGLGDFESLVEVTGNPDALDGILHQSPAGSRILLLGLPYAHRRYTFENIVAYDKMLVGSVGSAAKHFDLAIELLPQINTDVFMEKVLPLSGFKEAWEIARTGKHLKIILKVN
ncbi:MAG: alcohol dehydrogenase catalytic domain-containing protein [Desulfobacterales bacterium]|jgi:2-desacetyl-2-hydroxyethyl bacteriochlorophyllide A dehydrogenase